MPPASSAPSRALGRRTPGLRELIGADRFDEAFFILQPRLLDETVAPSMLFLYGLAAVGASQRANRTEEERDGLLNEAIAAFHAMLVHNPGLVRVRLELCVDRRPASRRLITPERCDPTLTAGDMPDKVKENVNLFLAEISARPRWLPEVATEVSLLASARQRWSGTTPDYRDLGGRLEVAHRLNPRLTAFAQTSWHDRRYRTRTHLDGPIWDASLRGVWTVTPTVRANLSGGYAQQRPKSRHGRHRGLASCLHGRWRRGDALKPMSVMAARLWMLSLEDRGQTARLPTGGDFRRRLSPCLVHRA